MDRGLVGVDEPLNEELLPQFRLFDQFASMRVTIRDLASHRTGVPYTTLSCFLFKAVMM